MSISLSVAISKGTPMVDGFTTALYNDPLGAALIGSMRPAELENFWSFLRSSSDVSACEYIQKSLYRTWPHLGQSVRAWPALATELEREHLLPPIRFYQVEYRQEIHMSLWAAITDMHAAGWSKSDIVALLGRNGL